jgi:hypothetical protein
MTNKGCALSDNVKVASPRLAPIPPQAQQRSTVAYKSLPTSLPYLILCILYFALLTWAKPNYGADPLGYADDAYRFTQHPSLANTRALWEFGHLIWRPLGALFMPVFEPLAARFPVQPNLVPLLVLITLSVLFTLMAVFLVYRITHLLSGSSTAGVIVSILFLISNAVLNYARSGYPYIPGLSMQLLAVSMIPTSFENTSRLWLRAFIIGCALAASICFWTPYLMTVPGIIAFSFLWKDKHPRAQRLRVSAQIGIVAFIAAGLVFGGAILLNHFRSSGEIFAWVRASSHGWSQSHRLIRLTTGLPRSLIVMGNHSLMLKRFYFHDPYARVSFGQALASLAWKPLLYTLAMAALVWTLAKSQPGRRLLMATLCCWIPLILFSVAIFEPGSDSRFLPGFALLFAALGFAATRIHWRHPTGWVLALFFGVTIVVNLASVSPSADATRSQNAERRLRALGNVWRPASTAVLLSFNDDGIFYFEAVAPFHPLNQFRFHFLDAIEPGTLRAAHFRQEFAGAVRQAWRDGGDVWISRRLIAARPLPEWSWVEGDASGVPWRVLSGYYRQFETDANIGGADGFLRIAQNQKNGQLLQKIEAKS